MSAPISAATRVQLSSGRIGVCLYDNPNITDDTLASAYVIFGDDTYVQVPRGTLTSLAGGFYPPLGPGN
jgi:hypothetical protein